jgi:CRP/FNR family transcriptional regulator, cyclic AMP receptor protein
MARIGFRSRHRDGEDAPAEPERGDSSESFFVQPDLGDEPRHDEWVFLAQGNEDDWERLVSYTRETTFRQGEVVIKAGETDRSLYFLTEGRLDLLLAHPNKPDRLVRTISAPAVIGEMGFVEDLPRSMTIRGMTPGKLLRMDFEAFERLSADQPAIAQNLLFELARVLSLRLRWATRAMSCGWQ